MFIVRQRESLEQEEEERMSETVAEAGSETREVGEAALEKAHTLVQNRKGQLNELHRALGESQSTMKELRLMEVRFQAEIEKANREHDEDVARLDAELEAARQQHAAQIKLSAERRDKALNHVKSMLGTQAAKLAQAMDDYRKAKRSLAKMLSELP